MATAEPEHEREDDDDGGGGVGVAAPPEEPATDTETSTDTGTRTKKQPPYAVVLHNDDVNGFDFVVGVLRKVFRYTRTKAFFLTMAVHVKGRSVVWSGTLELAELKADQVRSCGADPNARARASGGGSPLCVTVEPLPG